MQLTHIRLLVDDIDACFRFYRDVIGLSVKWGEEGSGYASFQAGPGIILALFGRCPMAEAVGTAALPASADCQDRALLNLHVDDLEAAVARLEAKGVSLVAGVTAHPEWGMRTAHLRDPDGTLIELYSPLLQSEWTQGLRDADQRYGQGPLPLMKNGFPAEAQAFWDAIPRQIQKRLLKNVWCSHCAGVTTIVDFEGRMEGGDLILTGRCAKCGGPVARLIEGG